jgi:hypothetical protein
MAAKKEAGAGGGGNVLQMPTSCCVDKCGKKIDRMNFCTEHYAWFKEGLVSKAGARPSDFDKKYQAYMTKKKSAA